MHLAFNAQQEKQGPCKIEALRQMANGKWQMANGLSV